MSVLRLEVALNLAMRALANGGKRTSPTSVEWEVYGQCTSPVEVKHTVRADTFHHKWVEVQPYRKVGFAAGEIPLPIIVKEAKSMTITMHTRCRKCERCLNQRRVEWRERGMVEWGKSFRTWFQTFTFRPEDHYSQKLETIQRLLVKGVLWEELKPHEQFAALDQTAYAILCKYFKRLRKNSKQKFRYMMICEEHEEQLEGFPHYHVFLHETTGNITYAMQRETWGYRGNIAQDAPGFMTTKLIKDDYAAWYITKYLNKSHGVRVRASGRYGESAAIAQETALGQSEVKPNVTNIHSE